MTNLIMRKAMPASDKSPDELLRNSLNNSILSSPCTFCRHSPDSLASKDRNPLRTLCAISLKNSDLFPFHVPLHGLHDPAKNVIGDRFHQRTGFCQTTADDVSTNLTKNRKGDGGTFRMGAQSADGRGTYPVGFGTTGEIVDGALKDFNVRKKLYV